MQRILIITLGILLSTGLFAQDFTLSGYLRDARTGEELLYATVSAAETSQGVTTNLYGFYSLTLPEGIYQINYSYVGYAPKSVTVELNQDTNLDIELETASAQLEEVVVVATNDNDNITNTEVSVLSLDVKDIKKIPVIFGEQDVLKTMQLLPGVSATSEGSSGFFVRGGDSGQNLMKRWNQ